MRPGARLQGLRAENSPSPKSLLWRCSKGKVVREKTFGRGGAILGWVIVVTEPKQGQKWGLMISFLWILSAWACVKTCLQILFCPCPTPWSRFDAGSGMATIRHPTPLALGQFHTVTLLRSLTQGSLIVGNLAPVNGTSQVRPNLSPFPALSLDLPQ